MSIFYAHIFAALTPILAAASQLIIKWQVNLAGPLPADIHGKLIFILDFLLRPWVIIALATTFISGIAWILAMTRLDLSYAYPYIALPFILVPLAAVLLFNESFNSSQALGIAFIIVGMIIALTNG